MLFFLGLTKQMVWLSGHLAFYSGCVVGLNLTWNTTLCDSQIFVLPLGVLV